MKAKIKVILKDEIYGHLTIDISIPKDQQLVAKMYGIGDEEQNNLIGQKMQEVLALMGNSDEA